MKDGLVYNVSIERVSVTVVSSSFSLVLSADSSSGLYVNSDIGLILVRCTKFQVESPALLKNFVFFSSGNASYHMIASVPRNSSDTFSVVSISYFSAMDTLLVSFEGLTSLSLEGVCGGANCGVALLRWPTVRMVEVAGTASVTHMLNVSIIASLANIVTRTPKSAVLFKCCDALALHNISIDITDYVVRFSGSPLDVAGSTRNFALAEVSVIDNGTNVSIAVKRCSLTFEQVAGGCVAALTPAINLNDNISFATVDVSDVTMTSTIANGSMFALNGALAVLTMGTIIVNVVMQTPSILNIGTNVHIIAH